MNTTLIKQPAGIGDVFYLQKFATVVRSWGSPVLWPLRDDIYWISDYVNLPRVTFCKLSEDFLHRDIYYSGEHKVVGDDFFFLSPDGLQYPGMRIMESKYALIGERDHDWYDYFHYKRKWDKEERLYNILGLKEDSQYVFLNSYSNTDIKYNNTLESLCFDLPRVNLQILDGFTLFDWGKVIENAQEIHTVHTSVNYIIEKLDIKASVYNMYQGSHSTDVQYIPFAKNPKFIRNEDI